MENDSAATEASSLLHHQQDHHHSSHTKHLSEDVPHYAPPRQRQRWEDEQILPHVNWGDLFFDLFYVAAAFNLAVIMKESLSLEGLLYFVCCYASMASVWYEKLLWDSRFAPEDNLFHRGTELVHLVLLGISIQHIRSPEVMKYTCEYDTTFAYAASMTMIWMLQALIYIDASVHVIGGPEAKICSRSDVVRKVLGTLPLLAAAGISGFDYFHRTGDEGICINGNRLPIILCSASFLVERAYTMWEMHFWFPWIGRSHKELKVPVNVEYVIHRLGEWTMLMLGESVLALLIVEESPGMRYYVTFCTGIISVTMMQYLYYRCNVSEADDHAMRRSTMGGFQYFYGLLAFSACLILIGCSFKLILHQYLDEMEHEESDEELRESSDFITKMFSWSLAGSFFCLDLMIVSHRGWAPNLSRMVKGGAVQIIPALCTLGLLSFLVIAAVLPCFVQNLELLSVAGCLLILAQVALRTLGLKYFPVSKHAMEVACRWPNRSEPRSIPCSKH